MKVEKLDVILSELSDAISRKDDALYFANMEIRDLKSRVELLEKELNTVQQG